jgi:transposase InsO family protein
MIKIANSDEFKDLNPHKIVVKLADSGRYIASESSFYRLLKTENLLAHRSKSRPRENHPPRCLVAKAPNQVWSWDITYLSTLVKGKFYYLYMIEDIFSRRV